MNKSDACPEIHQRATGILKAFYGENAVFRDGQYEAIEATMTQKRTLVVQRTGWGKSLDIFYMHKAPTGREPRCYNGCQPVARFNEESA